MKFRLLTAKRSLAFGLVLVALALLGSFTLTDNTADAIGTRGGEGCFWDRHTEIDYFATPDRAGTPVGWVVRTCQCNVYTSGQQTPYYTVVAETDCAFLPPPSNAP